jgi:LPS-assembly lipoprotein
VPLCSPRLHAAPALCRRRARRGGDRAALGKTWRRSPAGRHLIRGALTERLGGGGEAARFRLEVELDDRITGFGIRLDDAVTRERRTLRARYRLVDARLGTVLLDATAGSDAGVDVVGSEYATVAAEQTALERLSKVVAEQIVSRVALFVTRTPSPPQP